MLVLITGTADYIDSTLALQLAVQDDCVISIDNVNDYIRYRPETGEAGPSKSPQQ